MKKIAFLLLLATAGAYAQTEVKFAAKIQNRNSDSLLVRSRSFKKVLKADKTGAFKDAFAVETGFYQLFDGTENTTVFLKNGFDLNLAMDAKMFDESIVYKGKGEKENNYLAKKALETELLVEKLGKIEDIAQQKVLIDAFIANSEQQLKDPSLDVTFATALTKEIEADRKDLTAMGEDAAKALKMLGKPSPLFTYENFKGGTTSLNDLKGKYVYIDVWATWCGPCRQEIPFLQEVEKKYHGKKIEFVSISVDKAKDHEKWKKMVTDKSLGGVQLFADKDWASDFIQAYGINSIPRFILIGPDGKVVDADAKRPSDSELQVQLDSLLK
ncbi:MAG: TlpA family protein disulfide reductase [Flavobacterium psychrophilum]|nr:MAG: TlpA family protein disulfide reductase [Flavobacterium psychrophilum]